MIAEALGWKWATMAMRWRTDSIIAAVGTDHEVNGVVVTVRAVGPVGPGAVQEAPPTEHVAVLVGEFVVGDVPFCSNG